MSIDRTVFYTPLLALPRFIVESTTAPELI
jgi:hypothetical protein